jgi:DNA primase
MNVEEILTDKGIPFRPAGKDVLIHCLNPEHDDSSPSTRVHRISGMFHCFSCGHKGNVYDFFNELRDFKTEKVFHLRKKIRALLAGTKGLEIPSGSLPFNRDYRSIKASTFRSVDAFTSSDFEDRIVFPIRDVSGKIVAFCARHLHSGASPKYIISPSEVKLPIYPSNLKPHKGSVILVEGIFDAINLRDKGLDNVGCLFGTRTLSYDNAEDRLMPLVLAGTKLVYIMLDGDAAGIAAAKDIKKIITAKTRLVVEILEMAEGTDPGEFDQDTVDSIIHELYKKETK